MKVCAEPGCPNLSTESRCPAHARPSAARRGYGRQHRATREHWAPLVDMGAVTCWRCHKRIEPGSPWDLGHDDADRTTYRGPEHQRCNRSTAGRPRRVGQDLDGQ